MSSVFVVPSRRHFVDFSTLVCRSGMMVTRAVSSSRLGGGEDHEESGLDDDEEEEEEGEGAEEEEEEEDEDGDQVGFMQEFTPLDVCHNT